MKTKHKNMVVAALTLALACAAHAGDPTAFQLAKKGNDYVGVQSKDKVVQIRSEKSVGSMTPNIWYVVYYDPDSTFKAVEVKFGSGQKLDVSHPGRLLEMMGNDKDPLDTSKLKIDSDQALKIATDMPVLKNLTLKTSKMWLGHGEIGPEWRVRLWAAKLKSPNENADIGEVIFSAKDGELIKADLHPGNVD